jgi:hypothetical protein
MNDLNNLMNDFIEKKISMNNYISKIESFEINNNDNFNNFLLNYQETNKMDERMNALLILWFYKNKHFVNNLSCNPYLSYIYDLTQDIINPTLNIITLENDYLICKVNQFYFVINHNKKEVEIDLPEELKNKSVFCFNCNDDMILEETITLPEFSFYALEI